MVFLLILVAFFVWLSYSKLESRISDLEEMVAGGKIKSSVDTDKLTPIPSPAINHTRPTPFPVLANTKTDDVEINNAEEKEPNFLWEWFRDQTLIKIGAIFFFLGVAWFVSYAIKVGWFLPEMRILFGILLGLLSYVLGVYRSRVSKLQSVIFTALGTGILCVSIYAAQAVFFLVEPLVALVVLTSSIAYTIYVAIKSSTKWLIVASSLLGLAAPLLCGTESDPNLTLGYLLVLTCSLLVIGFKQEVSSLSLVLISGLILNEMLLGGSVSAISLQTFVAIVSFVIFISITKTIATKERPQASDILCILLVAFNFIFITAEFATSPSLAMFIATLVVGIVGYVLARWMVPIAILVVYILLFGLGILLTTSFLFSGYTLVLALIIEMTVAFMIVSYLGLPEKVIWLTTALYAIPLLSSLSSFHSQAWKYGFLQSDALVVISMQLSLLVLSFWFLHNKSVIVYHWSKYLALFFSVTAYAYAHGVIAVFAMSLFVTAQANVVIYVLYCLLNLLAVYYCLSRNLNISFTSGVACLFTIPVMISLPSFFGSGWVFGLNHVDGFGVLGVLVTWLLMILLLVQQYCKEYDRILRRLISVFLVGWTLYLFAIIAVLWHGLFGDSAEALSITYVCYTLIIYGFVALFTLLRTELIWIKLSLVGLFVPIVLSYGSVMLSGWPSGVYSAEAAGLTSLCILLTLLSYNLRRRYASKHAEDITAIKHWTRIIYALAFLYAVVIIWSLAQTVVIKTQAISLALFVYTILGLVATHYGKKLGKDEWKFAGNSLLILVVMRLLLVDVWEMELIWRIVTFLGIGSMFIATAFFDKPNK